MSYLELRKSIESIEFKNFGVTFEGHKTVFENVNFHLPMNDIVWVRGRSGSGKSVLVKVIIGLLNLHKGEYLINGLSVNDMDFEDFKPYCLNMGYSFDFGGLINNRTIEANLMLPLEYHSAHTPEKNQTTVQEIMRIFDLAQVAQQRPSSIVGGLRKAACVARAFVNEPEMLLLDDPSTGLRPAMIERLKELILEKRHSGQIKHVVIATEDERLMKNMNATIIDVENANLVIEKRRGAA